MAVGLDADHYINVSVENMVSTQIDGNVKFGGFTQIGGIAKSADYGPSGFTEG